MQFVRMKLFMYHTVQEVVILYLLARFQNPCVFLCLCGKCTM